MRADQPRYSGCKRARECLTFYSKKAMAYCHGFFAVTGKVFCTLEIAAIVQGRKKECGAFDTEARAAKENVSQRAARALVRQVEIWG